MGYNAPGRADELDEALAQAWNEVITSTYEGQAGRQTRFFTIEPHELENPSVTDDVHWPAAPREPTFCVDAETQRTLCDWGARGRHALQNEYCEYAVVGAVDGNGRRRPKRVQVTTELAEYWLCIAEHDPERVRGMATEVIGDEPHWEDLYGVPDPRPMSAEERRIAFATTVAGNGQNQALQGAGVPSEPIGSLNTESALFMSHPINGLDDLIFIVLFGAQRYAVRDSEGGLRRAALDDLFAKSPKLACRHADPTAALGAYDTVLSNRRLGFANPLGMYLRPFNPAVLLHEDKQIPTEWVRWSRGAEGMRQRLEVGPGDDDDAFLDEIQVAVGQEPEPLTGGHQLLSQLEVGPLLVTAPTSPAEPDEFTALRPGRPIDCHRTGVCDDVVALKQEHDRALTEGEGPRG